MSEGDANDASGSEAGRRDRMRREVVDGLGRPRKELPPKYFYDTRGSELFVAITELPEYYLTRKERELLSRWIPVWFDEIGPEALVELGAGSAEKTRILLDVMQEAGSTVYVPVDVSAAFLEETARDLRREYPTLRVHPEVADITGPLKLSVDLPGPTVFALLGSTLGNFRPGAAVELLTGVRGLMASDDVLLLGVDLRPEGGKSVATLEAAYNDSRGVTAEFNRNVLRVLSRELGADFDPSAFRHRAFWNEDQARIEMHLVSSEEQVVRVPGAGEFHFDAGESVRTEISCKYDRETVGDLFQGAGLALRAWREDPRGFYALVLGGPA